MEFTIRKPSLKVFVVALLCATFVSGVLLFSLIKMANTTPTVGGSFELKYRGAEWRFLDHNKRLNLLYIGYARCPDVCPMSLSVVAQAFLKFSENELKQIQLLFLSVDYQNDKPDDVADYAAQFFKDFVGLTGTKEQIDFVVNLFGASYLMEKNPKSYIGYSIAHTDKIFFLNEKGEVIKSIANPRSDEQIYQSVKQLL